MGQPTVLLADISDVDVATDDTDRIVRGPIVHHEYLHVRVGLS
jgi:hypothetical protein